MTPFHPIRWRLHRVMAASALLGLVNATQAADLSETGDVEFSGNRLAPTPWLLDTSFPAQGAPGLFANGLAGTVGRGAQGVVDRDYVSFVVPAGHQLAALRVGSQTTAGGAAGSFIGLAAGSTVPVDPSSTSAAGLLGWRLYSAADRTQDILPSMGVPSQGSAGFVAPLPAGTYTLWIQELATGTYRYQFDLAISPVPEPANWLLLTGGLVLLRTLTRPRKP